MSFSVDAFVSNPKLTALVTLKMSKLAVLANNYKLHMYVDVHSGMRKGDVLRLVSDYIIDENIVSDEETVDKSDGMIELKRL